MWLSKCWVFYFAWEKLTCSKVLDLLILLPGSIFITRNNTIKHLIDELTYKQYVEIHVNPTSMLMKPKQSMWGDPCFVVKI